MNLNIKEYFEELSFAICDIETQAEASEYDGYSFTLNSKRVLFRTGKTTPKKVGQFVTFWRRNTAGITEPYSETDDIYFYIIHCLADGREGQFIIPRATLIAKGILSTATKDGKRGFRVYPAWDTPKSKQAIKTQQWQLAYFVEWNAVDSSEQLIKLLS
jgi:hypothetical protein